MPTNLIRQKFNEKSDATPEASSSADRIAILRVGRKSVRLHLLLTRTADLIWNALPLHSIAETWGDSIHFDTPLKTGRERTAMLNVQPGDVCFWTEDERIVLPWGPTPISRPNEIRLMSPCNIWAHVIDDASVMRSVTPGEKVALTRSQ